MGLIDRAVISEGHITGFLDSVNVNADNITAGTIVADRLVVRYLDDEGNEQLALISGIDPETHIPTYEKLNGNILEYRTVEADRLVANSITSHEITTENIIGTAGWINLHEGTFNYGNVLVWDGVELTVKMFDLEALKVMYDQAIKRQAEISTGLDSISAVVGELSSRTQMSTNTRIQDWDVPEVPTLLNYPTFTDFFIWDTCSDNLYVDDELIIGRNNYDVHLNEVAKLNGFRRYFVFKHDEENGYWWRELTEVEILALSDKYASMNIYNDEIKLTVFFEDNISEMSLKEDGLRATTLYCC